MATKTINLRLVAYSDAAGKFDAQAPLNGNEDNFYVDDDISDDISGPTRLDTPVALSPMGCLLAVADGMGGQNAGEVASEIAVNTIAEFFRADRLTPAILKDDTSRAEYIRQVIIEADRRVKAGAEGHPERFGMGSTIIIAWIVDGILTVGWLGDSRCYRFNTRYGLVPVSCDHTYVQELASKGILSYNDTFSHPQGNIVTRSLGDPEANPQPETVSSQLYDGDIILMCSDGLSGVVPDRPMRDISDSINGIMTADYGDLTAMKNHLMEAAERQDWYDNVTVLLARFDGDLPAAPNAKTMAAADPTGSLAALLDEPATEIVSAPSTKAAGHSPKAAGDAAKAPRRSHAGRYIGIALVILLIAAAVFFAVKAFTGSEKGAEFTASEGDTPLRTAVDSYDSDDPHPADAAPRLPAGPDGTPATTPASPDGKDIPTTNGSHNPATDVDIVPVEDTGIKTPPDMINHVASKGVEPTWKESLIRRLDNIKVTNWNDYISSLKGKINNAGSGDRVKFENQVNYLTECALYARPFELDIIPKLSGDNKDKALKALRDFPKWNNLEKVKEEIDSFSKIADNSDK